MIVMTRTFQRRENETVCIENAAMRWLTTLEGLADVGHRRPTPIHAVVCAAP
jgi:hypothetical protein